MKLAEIRRNAFAMPLHDPAYPPGPYKFYNREFVVITYRTDIDKLREAVPEPLEVFGDTVAYEFIRMPDSTGFGDYTETGQVIPVRFKSKDGVVQEGGYVHAMYLDDNAPIAGGREIWGFPKKLASRKVSHEGDVVVCTLHYGSVLCVSATMGFNHREGSTRRRCSRRSPGRTSCSRSSRMSTARRGSASWCATTWKTSR
jgi:acetoacetate decarboxylase